MDAVVEVSGRVARAGLNRVRVKREALVAVQEQCQRTLELLSYSGGVDDGDGGGEGSAPRCADREADQLHVLIKSRVECPGFLEKLENVQVAVPNNSVEEGNYWDMVTVNDLWEGENIDADKEDYVLVKQEDVIEGIASFMVAYLLSLKQTKELSPDQLQDALSKTFSVTRKKGKLQKAWDGSKVIYNVASWGATAIGFSKLLLTVTAILDPLFQALFSLRFSKKSRISCGRWKSLRCFLFST